MALTKYMPAATAGTYVVRTTPGVIESIYAVGGTAGKISIYDAAGTALPGTVTYEWTPAAAVDVLSGKHIDMPVSTGVVMVLAANSRVTMTLNDVAR